jgi:rfaE bifunctional protein nucleotidyltransferase chain/domain
VAARRSDGYKVGFTCGSFDILHAGHVHYLREARSLCDQLLVAVNSDESVRQYKGQLRPVVPEQERIAIISALECVDGVTLLDERRPLGLIQAVRPDFYIKGADYSLEELKSRNEVEAYGGKVVLIPIAHPTSTSSVIDRIRERFSYSEPSVTNTRGGRLALLDRDGTLIKDVPYLGDPRRVELLPGVGEGLATLQRGGFRLVMVTNQQGIGLGYYSTEEFACVNRRLFCLLQDYQIQFSRIYFCPHSLAEGCECRKPRAGMLTRAMQYFQASPKDCFMVGDSVADIVAAQQAGCPAVLINEQAGAACAFRASSFDEAAKWIVDSLGRGDQARL